MSKALEAYEKWEMKGVDSLMELPKQAFLEGFKQAVQEAEKEMDHFIQSAWSDRSKKDTPFWKDVCSSVAMNFGRCKDRISALLKE